MGDLWDDIKHSLHMFFKNPAFTFTAVSALALGIGANTAIFTVVNTVLLKPLLYPDAERIVKFYRAFPDGTRPEASVPEFHVLQQQTSVFQDVAAYDSFESGYNLTGGRPEQIHGIHVTGSYFRVFGAPVLLGRTFTPQEDAPNGGQVVVLSYNIWQRKLAGNPNVVGTSLSLGNEPYTIVGVLGRGFTSDPEADIWLPFQFDPVSNNLGHFFMAAALLHPNITMAQANAQMKLAAAQFLRAYPQADPHQGFAVEPLRDSIVGDVRKSLLILLGAVSLVMLIACANVANLLLVHATGRRREFALRSALGAGRVRIIRQLLTESLLLSLAGGIWGLILGFAGVRALLAVSPAGLPRIGEDGAGIGLDWRVLGFTLAVSIATGVLFGLFPAFTASRTNLNSSLKEGSSRSGTSFRQGKTRSLLIVTEVCLALVMLVGAALLIRTFVALHHVYPGFDAHNVLTLEMSLAGGRFKTTETVAQLSRNGLNRLSAIPGVEASALTCCLPIQAEYGLPFQILGRPVEKGKAGGAWMSASPGYLNVFKIPLLRGRDFKETDTASTPGVVLINQALAKLNWPNEDPVGQQIIIGKGIGPEYEEPPRQIIGVVGDTHTDGLGHPPGPMMIVPLAQVTDGMTALNSRYLPVKWTLRTKGDPHTLIAVVSEQLRQTSGGFPVARVRTMDEVIGRSVARETFNMLLLAIFGVVALVLASIGIYGILAYSVQQRTQEMGVRIALGANRSDIRKLVIWHGMRLAIVGIVVGIAAALGLTRLIASFLFGVKPWDPEAFLFAPLILFAVSFFAVWIPATRASKLDPMQALRVE